MTSQQLEQLASLLAAEGINANSVLRIRSVTAGMHVTVCSDDDVMGIEPVARLPGLCVYLVDGRQHCPVLTTDLEIATGLVLAEVSEA